MHIGITSAIKKKKNTKYIKNIIWKNKSSVSSNYCCSALPRLVFRVTVHITHTIINSNVIEALGNE